MKCNYCGQEGANTVDTNGIASCSRCVNMFGTCAMCTEANKCDFETNPIDLPKQVQKVIRQGNMAIQTVVKNEARIIACCLPCICFNKENQICNKEYGTCCNYKELLPVCPSNS